MSATPANRRSRKASTKTPTADESLFATSKRRLANRIVRAAAEGLVLEGKIDPTGKSERKLQAEVLDLLKRNLGETRFLMAIDYTATFVRQARRFEKTGSPEIACLFYATWFEHWLNRIISTMGKRRKLSEEELTQIIRDTPFRAKCTWLLRLLGLKRINEAHLKRIQYANDSRNAFVHYKWKAHDVEEQEVLKKSLPEIRKTVRYLQSLENKYFFRGKKKKVVPL